MNEKAQSFSRLTAWDLPRFYVWREMAVMALVLMELSWVVPWYRALTPATSEVTPQRAFFVLGGLLILAMLAYRFMNFLKLKTNIRQWFLLVLLFVSILIGTKTLLYSREQIQFWELVIRPIEAIVSLTDLVPDEFLISALVLLAWWRGISLARLRVGPRDVLAKFQFGFGMLLLFILINTLVTGEDIGILLYTYVFGGVLAMGAARIAVIGNLRGGQHNPFDRRWFAGVLMATVGLVGLVAVIVLFVTGESAVLSQIILLFWGVLVVLALFVAAPIMLLALNLVEWYLRRAGDEPLRLFESLGQTLGLLKDNLLALMERLAELAESIGLFKFVTWLPNLQPVVRLLILSGLIFLVVVLAAIKLRIANNHNQLEEERDWLLKRGDLLRMLRKALEDQWKKLAVGLSGVTQVRRLLAAARIRRIYLQMINLAADMGHPRMQAETPLEFLETLNRLFPLVKADALKITKAYLQVRYGELPESRSEVHEVEQAWEALKQAANDFKSTG